MFPKMNRTKFIVNHHHIKICDVLDAIVDGKLRKVIFNIAPRYTKTELVVKTFMAYGFAINPACNFINISYSDELANDNSEEVRDIVKSSEYRALFPYVQIKHGSDSKKKWSTTAGGGVYAVASGGQITGFGAGVMDEEEMADAINSVDVGQDRTTFAGAIIIDDPIKPEDALSETVRERVNNRFETTIRNRVNSRNTPIIIIMQRLHEHDLCGYLIELEPDEWTVISLPCIYEEGGVKKALWPHKHTLEELYKIKEANSYVFETQYMQNPKPIEGLMYEKFKTYEILPATEIYIAKNYTDTADEGKDYLCSICYIDTEIGNFVTDILFTQKPMEYTEPATAQLLTKNGTIIANIESNNGGRGFARAVEKQLRIMGNNRTKINWFHQSENKNERIFNHSFEVQNLTYFPNDWNRRWPEFYKHITSYRKEGKNIHDDAEDCLTGTVEKRVKVKGLSISQLAGCLP
jgi:predicted phage terminase large subunit-like protein